MKANFIILFLVSILLPLNCKYESKNAHPFVQSGFLDLSKVNFEENVSFDLNGKWEFYWMEFLKFEEQNLEKRTWMEVPSVWQDAGYPEKGYATYRLELQLPDHIDHLALDMRSVACSYEVYVNAELVGKQGKIGTDELHSEPFFKHSIHEINSSFIKQNRVIVSIYVSNYHYFKGGVWDTISIGLSRKIAEEERKNFILELCVLNCLLIMGIYHIGLYITRRRDKSPLYFAIFSFLVALRTVSINERLLLDLFPFLHFDFVNKIDYFTFFISGSLFLKFVESLFPEEANAKISKWLHLFYLPPALLVCFTPMYVFGRAVTFVEFGIFLTMVYIAIMLLRALRSRRLGAKLYISGFVILALTAVHDILKGKEIVYTPYTLAYGLVTFIIFQAAILTRKYAAAFIKSEELARDLEDKVIKRTSELQASLEEVKNLKLQQDGDYFLTSQLLKPLNKSKAKSELVSIEFFAQQKKKFQFRDWQEEIGGDLCMSNQITLRGKNYTVFVNADAMGKSLQGASGALVFGTVFESIINRNQTTTLTNHLFPETWIKQAFVELHRVFETFDGSMLVSLVMGLIAEETGFLYLIRADHPPSVLLRDGKAIFLGSEKNLRKLGTLGANETISIFTYQLFPSDILILGSDGRDDLLLKTEDGSMQFNENDSLFLEHVEKSEGDLALIYKEIMRIGNQYDDLTLVKLSVDSHINRKSDTDQIKKRKIETLLGEKKFDQAILFFEEMQEDLESDTEILYLLSYAYKKIGNMNLALEVGERVYLREPNHIENLLNLAEVYMHLANHKKAKSLLNEILLIDANHLQAKQLLENGKEHFSSSFTREEKLP